MACISSNTVMFDLSVRVKPVSFEVVHEQGLDRLVQC